MKLFMIGDSTMKLNNIQRYPCTGWGQVMQMFVREGVWVEDYAENGRSTKSFIDEGRFDVILERMEPGDFLIVEFGHNDEKKQDPTRYTEPFGDYQKNLKYFAESFEAKGGHVVFATSITRHTFENGVCVNTHGDYPKAMLEFCKANNYTCIDMNKLTLDLYNSIGEEKSSKFHMIFPANTYKNYINGSDDHSHLVYIGALAIAEVFVKNVFKTNDPIKDSLIDLSQEEVMDWDMLNDYF